MKKDYLKTFLQDVKQEIPTHLDELSKEYPYIFKTKELKPLAKKYLSVLENILQKSNLPTKVVDTVLKTLKEDEHDPIVIGITGTVGKTSVAYLLSEYLQALGKKVTLLSSASLMNPLSKVSKDFCQPVPIKSHNFLKDFIQTSINYNAEYIIIEVSEEAITDGRVANIPFDIKVLTQFWEYWLRGRISKEDYLARKSSFFSNEKETKYFYNVSSEKLEEFMAKANSPLLYGSKLNHNNISLSNIDYGIKDFFVTFEKQYLEIQTPSKLVALRTKTLYNYAYAINVSCVVGILDYLNILNVEILQDVLNTIVVPGRKIITRNNRTFIITQNYLNDIYMVKEVFEETDVLKAFEITGEDYSSIRNRILVLDGVVGWKPYWQDSANVSVEDYYNHLKNNYSVYSNSKSMAFEAVDKYYITNVNPGDCDKEYLLDYLESVYSKSYKPITRISDRKDCIKQIVLDSEPNDVILISGRASFNQYEDGEEILYFTDEDILLHTLEELKW